MWTKKASILKSWAKVGLTLVLSPWSTVSGGDHEASVSQELLGQEKKYAGKLAMQHLQKPGYSMIGLKGFC